MGEIRSTLDIIMEKTKGLTMTEDEKAAFQRSEVEEEIKPILQKYLDGRIDPERVGIEIVALGEEKEDMAMEILKKECLARIEPEGDNSGLFDLLGRAVGLDTGPFLEAVSTFQKEMKRQRARHGEAFRVRLQERGISGSALIPNPNADVEFIRYADQKREELRERLSALASQQ